MTRVRALIASLLLIMPAIALAAGEFVMHRDPGCPCCAKWAAMVREQFGRSVKILDDPRRAALQKRMGVPNKLSSCHTAVIDNYIFEGHVPIADMKKLIAERPEGVRGLAVAGMPMGSPGMEVAGRKAQPFDVMAFGTAGTRIFARHR